ncbi:MAG: UDP-N-acetylmuramate--L-alanine ligase [Actinomycetota bacterium]|nr:UDP-N-acetylmuramate--L-alanine ligase [Actinomycetota bacterium]
MTIPYRRIHIIGAGGAGMSALAKVLVGRGHQVSGSDLRGGPALDALADIGMEVATGHNPSMAVNADLVVASSAVPEYDEELESAREAGIPTWRRPQLLAALTSTIRTIGATGTHGKTTTTALLISALHHRGDDPSFILGGEIAGLGTNGHVGETPLLVLESDEAFRTFEGLELNGLVVTNVEPEHIDHFGSEAALADAFAEVAAGVDGPVVSCIDDPGSARVAERAETLTYGFGEGAVWRLSDYRRADQSSTFMLTGPQASIEVGLALPGRHVALNAAGALSLLAELGYPLEELVPGVGHFRGVGRRWEHRGTVEGVMLVDDYAHHPTEVKATLDAAEGVVPGRVWAVFQPHLYSRTEMFHEEFGQALAAADKVIVTDVYGAREIPVPGVTGELIVDAAFEAGADVTYVPHRSDLADYLLPLVQDGDLVLSMGAGDITLLPGELAVRLGER